MRIAAFTLLVLVAGCNSGRHDYYSINRQSREFLRHSAEESATMRKKSWNEFWHNPARVQEKRRIRKEGMKFAIDSIFGDTWTRFGEIGVGIRRELREDREIRKSGSMRFGFVDSGD